MCKECYQCGKKVQWLAPDSRCGECTRYTPEEITGEETFSDEDDWGHDMSDHQIDVECYINLYKSVYGIKPRGVQSMSDEWLQRGIEELDKLGEENETEK